MTDRELLEAAAKAAGFQIAFDARGPYEVTPGISGNDKSWNPLTDDGDALRLAVKLRLNLEFFSQGVHVMSLDAQPYENDPNAAVRRAIVRAAASTASQNAGEEGA